jgi:hypothetical protein
MATTIQIKRSGNVAAPTTADLLEGELAYSYDKSNNGANAKLYIEVQDSGGGEVIHTIGGRYYTSRVDAATSANTVSTIVARDSLGNFSANTITANSFVGNIVATSAQSLSTARRINLSGDLEGNVLFDGTQDVTIVANVINNSVTLGTDTVGDYVANLTAGSGITLTNAGGESANVTVGLATSGVAANTYGGTTNIPVITVDTFGRITSAANAAISTSFNLAADTGTADTFNSGDTLRVSGGTGISTAVTDNTITVTNLGVTGVATGFGLSTSAANGSITLNNTGVTSLTAGTGIGVDTTSGNVTLTNLGVTSLTGTANEVEVSSANGAITIGLPDNVTIGNTLTVTGDLIVLGNATTLNTATLTVEDPLVKFGNANPSDVLDIGFFGEYVNSGTKFAGLFRDASDSGKFKLFNDLTSNPTGNVVSVADYTIASLVANLTGGTISGLTANIGVGDGGTGRGTFTTNGILFGNATGALRVTAAGTHGQVLQAGSDGTPVYGGIDGGTY